MNELHDFWSSAVVYQIYPRSFKDNNGDGIGDLEGIIEKLDYLNDGTPNSLGVDVIWLSPIYPSPMVDFGYDVSDYCNIHPMFGNLDTFNRLVSEAHKRGIRIMMDYIPNHTSNQHPWFIESSSSRQNPKRDWYIWADGQGENPPNNWLSVFGGSGWHWNESSGQYYFHSFLQEQPDLNWRNPEVQKAMLDVLKFWSDRGVDGFRVDAIYHMFKDDLLRNDPINKDFQAGKDDPYASILHTFSVGRSETLKMIGKFSDFLLRLGGKFIVVEAYVGLEEMVKIYRASENGLHAPFNFNFIFSLPWLAGDYKKFIDNYVTALRPQDIPNYVLGNHDRSRVVSRVGLARARALAFLTLTLPGMPFVYYGEEIGMQDAVIPPELVQDPFEKNVPGMGLGRDPERTPMQWDNSVFGGFSFHKPWLPLEKHYSEVNVDHELKSPNSTLRFYQNLIHFRKSTPALLSGALELMELENPEILQYARKLGEQEYRIVINFSQNKQALQFNTSFLVIMSSARVLDQEKSPINSITLAGYEACLLEKIH